MSKKILAVVTRKRDEVAGGAPIFIQESKEKVQQTAFTLEKILDGMVHQISEETVIIVRHK